MNKKARIWRTRETARVDEPDVGPNVVFDDVFNVGFNVVANVGFNVGLSNACTSLM